MELCPLLKLFVHIGSVVLRYNNQSLRITTRRVDFGNCYNWWRARLLCCGCAFIRRRSHGATVEAQYQGFFCGFRIRLWRFLRWKRQICQIGGSAGRHLLIERKPRKVPKQSIIVFTLFIRGCWCYSFLLFQLFEWLITRNIITSVAFRLVDRTNLFWNIVDSLNLFCNTETLSVNAHPPTQTMIVIRE